jgi:hypothetical protein
MSQQGLRQASVRAVSGTTLNYEGDWHAMWDLQGIAAGPFNQRMLLYINEYLGTSYTEINGAMAAFAANLGASTFQAIGTFDASLFEAEAQTLFDAMVSEPDADRKEAINDFFVAGKDHGWLAKTLMLYVYSAHDVSGGDSQAGKLNWISRNYDLTGVNSPTFTAKVGVTFDGATNYFGTGVAPNALTGLGQNDAHIGAYIHAAGNGLAAIGRSTAGAQMLLHPRTGGSYTIRVNASGGPVDTIASAVGHLVGTRSAADVTDAYKDGVAIPGSSFASSALDSAEILIGRTGTAYSSDTHFMTHIGNHLTAQQAADFYADAAALKAALAV